MIERVKAMIKREMCNKGRENIIERKYSIIEREKLIEIEKYD